MPTFLYLEKMAGGNDGVVPAASQRFGEVLGEIEADHWTQISWSDRYDVRPLYSDLLLTLKRGGL